MTDLKENIAAFLIKYYSGFALNASESERSNDAEEIIKIIDRYFEP